MARALLRNSCAVCLFRKLYSRSFAEVSGLIAGRVAGLAQGIIKGKLFKISGLGGFIALCKVMNVLCLMSSIDSFCAPLPPNCSGFSANWRHFVILE